MAQRQLTLLYDGACPFCRREIAWMRRQNSELKVGFEDIAAASFDPSRFGLTHAEVQRQMHGIRADGTVLRGVDAFREAYQALGFGWIVAPLKMPGVHSAAQLAYAAFARYRVPLGRLFGRGKCETGACGTG